MREYAYQAGAKGKQGEGIARYRCPRNRRTIPVQRASRRIFIRIRRSISFRTLHSPNDVPYEPSFGGLLLWNRINPDGTPLTGSHHIHHAALLDERFQECAPHVSPRWFFSYSFNPPIPTRAAVCSPPTLYTFRASREKGIIGFMVRQSVQCACIADLLNISPATAA
jgi:hypothetical protein